MKLKDTFIAVQQASRKLITISDAIKNEVLESIAMEIIAESESILAENLKDLERMDPENPKYDRLMLTAQRLKDISNDILKVATLPTPLDKVLAERTLPNGMSLTKIKIGRASCTERVLR